MFRRLFIRCFLGSLLLALAAGAGAQSRTSKFDPTRDAAKDVDQAVATAKAEGKRVLVDVGGEWCSWCHLLDHFVDTHPDVRQLVESRYVWVKVNWSPQNRNEALLARWPRIRGYPHLFVLDAEGKLLHSQNTGELESAKDYDKPKFLAFLRQHAAR